MRDLVIIGGGLVGLCAALVLQHTGRRVSIIEAEDFQREQEGGLNARSIALAMSSRQIFRALGLWHEIRARATAIRHIHISARGRWGVTRLHAGDYDLDALGYVIENRHLLASLRTAAEASADIEILDRAEFKSITQQDAVKIGYRREGKARRLSARLALIADGAQSRARAALDISHQTIDYGQSVVIANVEVDRPRDDTAYERFTSDGPLAMLPLGDRRYGCVWTMRPQPAETIGQLDESQFCRALQDSFGYRLGLIERAGERFAVPLRRVRAEALQRGRCLIVGSAANALHPVAGQSFNLALRDIAALYELLIECSATGLDDVMLRELAQEYEGQRTAEQSRVIRYGDGLVSLFSNELPLLNRARAVGLGLLDLVPALKAQAALAGMGMSFGGNRLLRGQL